MFLLILSSKSSSDLCHKPSKLSSKHQWERHRRVTCYVNAVQETRRVLDGIISDTTDCPLLRFSGIICCPGCVCVACGRARGQMMNNHDAQKAVWARHKCLQAPGEVLKCSSAGLTNPYRIWTLTNACCMPTTQDKDCAAVSPNHCNFTAITNLIQWLTSTNRCAAIPRRLIITELKNKCSGNVRKVATELRGLCSKSGRRNKMK